MKRLLCLVLILLSLPEIGRAYCSTEGASIVYINGVLGNYTDAQNDLFHLQDIFVRLDPRTDLTFINAYNPSHLAGFGDWLKSLEQVYQHNTSLINDYDFQQMLQSIYPLLTTRKVMLLGHSQGSFYANALYDYLVSHGIPPQSIGVYEIANPASFVAGGGRYLTSSTDKLIENVRLLSSVLNAPVPLPANIAIPLSNDEMNDPYGGHKLSTVYIPGAGKRIAGDMKETLSQLSASSTAPHDNCFIPPPLTFLSKVESIAFGLADPAATFVYHIGAATYQELASLIATASGTLSSLLNEDLFQSSFADNDVLIVAAAEHIGQLKKIPSPKVDSQLFETATTSPIKNVPSTQSTSEVFDNSSSTPPLSDSSSSYSTSTEVLPTNNFPALPYPGFGGGGSLPNTTISQEAEAVTAIVPELTIISPDDNAIFATSTVMFVGTSTPEATIIVQFGVAQSTTTADEEGNWSIAANLTDGSYTAVLNARAGLDGFVSVTRDFLIDTTPPLPPTIAIEECAGLFVCRVSSGTVRVQWDAIEDASEYGVFLNGNSILTTTALSATVPLAQGLSVIEVSSIDLAGNTATSAPLSVTLFTPPVPIIIQL